MSLTFNTKTYNADAFDLNLAGYAGPAHTATTKDKLSIGRTAAKPTSVFSGVTRTDSKLTRTLALTNALTPTGDFILEIKTSCPVGASSTDIDAAINDAAAYLALADYKTVVKNSKINF